VTRIAVTTIIDAPPDAVWHVVEPLERHVDWMADAVAIRFVGEQTRGAGARFDCDTKVGPITLTDRMEITEWDPGRVMGVRHSGVVTGTGRFTLERAGARGTVFSWEEELRFPWWLGGPIGSAIGGRLVLRRIWKRNLRALRRLVEAGALDRAQPTVVA